MAFSKNNTVEVNHDFRGPCKNSAFGGSTVLLMDRVFAMEPRLMKPDAWMADKIIAGRYRPQIVHGIPVRRKRYYRKELLLSSSFRPVGVPTRICRSTSLRLLLLLVEHCRVVVRLISLKATWTCR